MTLGNRVYLMGSLNAPVEEYNIEQNSWTKMQYDLMTPRYLAKAVSVPAAWFNHLPGGCNGVF